MKKRVTVTKAKGKGRTLSLVKSDKLPKPVDLHLLVTRPSGDTERYKLGTVPSMMCAIEYRRRLVAVKIPKRFMKVWRTA